jgi:hypothetical protein
MLHTSPVIAKESHIIMPEPEAIVNLLGSPPRNISRLTNPNEAYHSQWTPIVLVEKSAAALTRDLKHGTIRVVNVYKHRFRLWVVWRPFLGALEDVFSAGSLLWFLVNVYF